MKMLGESSDKTSYNLDLGPALACAQFKEDQGLKFGSSGRIRTYNPSVNSYMVYRRIDFELLISIAPSCYF